MRTSAIAPSRSPTAESEPPGSTSQAAFERDLVLDRLHSLRRVLPALAQEMAAARRQAAHLRTANMRLTEQVRKLRGELEARSRR